MARRKGARSRSGPKRLAPRRAGREGAAAQPGSSSLVRDLVHQFGDPLTFYRELIQNSIDAGSNRIDVTLRYQAGRAVVHVEDDGEGMDEPVIDNYLLVLFSSTKENDFTKIGKFGIGFVSVFAPRPERVRVYTAKNGESWRLDFPSYKRYEKYRVSQMREGTLVELIKPMTPLEYPRFVEDSLRTVLFWCRHSEARIFFQDKSSRGPARLVNEPFELPGGCSVRYEEEGTEVVAGFSAEERPFYGFYNRGLTLKEANHAFFPGVSFKVKSRYLEHTLTRDNVLEDENYHKAIGIMKTLVVKELPRAIRGELEAAASKPDAAAVWTPRAPFLQTLFEGFLATERRSDWAVFPTLSGEPATLNAASDAARQMSGKLYFDERPSQASRTLEARGVPVFREGPWLGLLEARTGARRVQASTSLICPKVLEQVPAETGRFLDALSELDRRTGPAYKGVLIADFGEPVAGVEPPFFAAQREPGRPLELDERETASFFRAGRYALLNRAHSAFKTLDRLFRRRPALAVFLGLKLMRLHDGDVPPDKAKDYNALASDLERKLLEEALAWEGQAAERP